MDVFSLQKSLEIVALGTTLFVIVLGCILAYHWFRYAMNHIATSIALVAYCAISAALLLALFASLYAL